MRKKYSELVEAGRERRGSFGSRPGDHHGAFRIRQPETGNVFICLVSDSLAWRAEGMPDPPWEHVSVNLAGQSRCPVWKEMCWIKDLFFEPEECVLQYHPPVSRYVNQHPFVLHLWRPVGVEIPMPPQECV